MARNARVFVTDSSGHRQPTEQDLDLSYSGNGSVPSSALAGGVSVTEYGGGMVHKTVFTLSSLSVTMTDHTTAGCHGSQQIYDWPEGLLTILGATTNLTTAKGSGGLATGAALVGSLGTVTTQTDNATLTTTEADIIPSTSGTFTSSAGTLKGKSTTSQLVQFDGTATAKDLYLNLAVPDADSSADDTVTVSGTITVLWLNAGDN